MEIFKKYFIYIIIGCFLLFGNLSPCFADEVCFTEQTAVDIITLLDASERDLVLLSSCESLVKELEKEIKIRDEKIVSLTKELIEARQTAVKYEKKYKRARQVAWYTSIAGAIIIAVQTLPAL